MSLFSSLSLADKKDFGQYLLTHFRDWRRERNRTAYKCRQTRRANKKYTNGDILSPSSSPKQQVQTKNPKPLNSKKLQEVLELQSKQISKLMCDISDLKLRQQRAQENELKLENELQLAMEEIKRKDSKIQALNSELQQTRRGKETPTILQNTDGSSVSLKQENDRNPKKGQSLATVTLMKEKAQDAEPIKIKNQTLFLSPIQSKVKESRFVNLPMVKLYVDNNLRGKSTTQFGRWLLIAGITKIYGWERFELMNKERVVEIFWTQWKKKMEEWGAMVPSTTHDKILASLSTHSTDIPGFVLNYVLTLRSPS
jgi:hypothetical protein